MLLVNSTSSAKTRHNDQLVHVKHTGHILHTLSSSTVTLSF